MKYMIIGLFLLFAGNIYAQVRGTVKDSTGEAIPGANVFWMNTGQGAVSYTHLDVYKRQNLLLSKKWVFSFLHSDRRRSTVSGVNDSFVGEDKQTAANVLYQFIEVASCEIGTADAALK